MNGEYSRHLTGHWSCLIELIHHGETRRNSEMHDWEGGRDADHVPYIYCGYFQWPGDGRRQEATCSNRLRAAFRVIVLCRSLSIANIFSLGSAPHIEYHRFANSPARPAGILE